MDGPNPALGLIESYRTPTLRYLPKYIDSWPCSVRSRSLGNRNDADGTYFFAKPQHSRRACAALAAGDAVGRVLYLHQARRRNYPTDHVDRGAHLDCGIAAACDHAGARAAAAEGCRGLAALFVSGLPQQRAPVDADSLLRQLARRGPSDYSQFNIAHLHVFLCVR